MPIGKIQRKASNETLSSIDGTLDSRLSSTDIPKMELLKINYVHQCKEAIMTKTEQPLHPAPPIPRLLKPQTKPCPQSPTNPSSFKFAAYKKLAPTNTPQAQLHNLSNLSPAIRKLSTNCQLLPPPTIESWQFLQNKRALNSPPKLLPPQKSDPPCCHSANSPNCSDSDQCTDSTLTPVCERSNSWDYRSKVSTCDIRRDIARGGIKSRADRIARIEKTECVHRQQDSPKLTSTNRASSVTRSSPTVVVAQINQMFEHHKQQQEHEANDMRRRTTPPQPRRLAPVLLQPIKVPNARKRGLTPPKSNTTGHERIIRINSNEDCNCIPELLQESPTERHSLGSRQHSEGHTNKHISRIPKPISADGANRNSAMLFTEASDQLQRKVQQRHQPDNQHIKSHEDKTASKSVNAPLNQSLANSSLDQLPPKQTQQQSPHLHRPKVERIHIRKKRQPLLIINQLTNEPPKNFVEKLPTTSQNQSERQSCGYRNCNFANCPMSAQHDDNSAHSDYTEKLKRLSLGSNSDSGISSEDQHQLKENNLKNITEQCSDCEDILRKQGAKDASCARDIHAYTMVQKLESLPTKEAGCEKEPNKHSSQIKIMHGKQADLNDVQNFAKKNLTKATTDEILTAAISNSMSKSVARSASKSKQCNIDNDLKNNEQRKVNNLRKQIIRSDDSWVNVADDVRSSERNEASANKSRDSNDSSRTSAENCVTIFVRSSDDALHASQNKRASAVSTTSIASHSSDSSSQSGTSAPTSSSSSSSCTSSASSAASTTSSSSCCGGFSSGCGDSSAADTQSLCDSEKDCCCHLAEPCNDAGICFNQSMVAAADECNPDSRSAISPTGVNSEPSCSASACKDTNTGCCVGGIFWNSNYFYNDAYAGDSPCCCSLSSCDDDNCSYYDDDCGSNVGIGGSVVDASIGSNVDNVDACCNTNYRLGVTQIDRFDKESYDMLHHRYHHNNEQQQRKQHMRLQRNSSAEMHLLRNNKAFRKTDVLHDLRPRSMDGVIDSGVSLNGDTGSSPDSIEHMQSQQDSEARRLKRGHVLSELLETERIYVNEMSSILKFDPRRSLKKSKKKIPQLSRGHKMRYGGYDLRKATKSKSSSVHSSFRLRKVQNTASNIVGKFNLKISDSIKRLQLQRSTNSESPLSFQDSLFDQHSAAGRRKRSVRYNPEDFRPHIKLASNDQPSYIFGTNVFNFSARNVLSGKSTIKIINTFREIEQSGDSETDVVSARNSLQRLKDERKTIFKELIELSSCDESLEYRLVKDYLECNSYSEIENDSEFKHYLQRKNYTDILDYLNKSEPQSFTSLSSSVARAQSALSKSSLNNAKVLSTPKMLNLSQSTPEIYSQLCNACRTITKKERPLKWCPNDLTENAPVECSSDNSKRKPNVFASSYREILKYCSEFFEESFGSSSSGKYTLPKFTFSRFSEQKYDRVLKQFVTGQGFASVAEYVEDKFGQFISCELAAFCADEKSGTGHKTRSKMESNGYCDQMQSEELSHLVPASLQGKEDLLFGNLHELYTFHNEIFLKDLENCISTTELVALCFVQRRDTFYRLYSFYCQNIPRSDRLRETLVDTHLFLQECQKRLGHKLPLAAYLLKPVQRITKYQLLLKDLLRFSDSGSCTKELQKALDCMLIVLKCVNDSMHQVAITGFPSDLSQQGELLLQDSFQVWTESKKDIRLRIKPQQRHIFLYQKSMLFCKQTSKTGHNKSTYQFKHYLKMSQIGLTESVRGDVKRFEVWLQGRQEVHTLQAPTLEIKNKWVAEIKRVLLNQLEELKGEKIKQYGLNHRGLRQTTSWDTPNILMGTPQRTISCDGSSESSNRNSNCSSSGDDNCCPSTPGALAGAGGISLISSTSTTTTTTTDKDGAPDVCGWSSDYSNSEDEMSTIEDNSTPGSKFIALADYVAMGHSEVSMREGDSVELLKVGCAGWWFVRVLEANAEGWTPAAYLESFNRKSSRSSSRNQERMNINLQKLPE